MKLSGFNTPNWGAISADLVPDQLNVRSLGSASKQWRDLFVSNQATIGFLSTVWVNSALTPLNDTAYNVGTSAKRWGQGWFSAGVACGGLQVTSGGFASAATVGKDANYGMTFTGSSGTSYDFMFFRRDGSSGAFGVDTAGNFQSFQGISSVQPSANGAGLWKIGKLVTAAVTLNTTRYIEVSVDGTIYKFLTGN